MCKRHHVPVSLLSAASQTSKIIYEGVEGCKFARTEGQFRFSHQPEVCVFVSFERGTWRKPMKEHVNHTCSRKNQHAPTQFCIVVYLYYYDLCMHQLQLWNMGE